MISDREFHEKKRVFFNFLPVNHIVHPRNPDPKTSPRASLPTLCDCLNTFVAFNLD